MTTCAVLGLLLPTSLLFYTVSAWVLAAIRVAPGWQMITGAALVYVSTMISGLAAVVLAMTLARTLLGVQVDLMVVQRLAAVLYIAIPALGFCLFAETARMARAAEPDGTHLFRELVVGPYAAVFWLIQVGGVVLPFLALALPGRLTPGRIGAAALLVMSGIVLERWMLIVPPLLGHAHRLYANGGYHPALAEVLTTAAAYVLAVPAARALKTVAV
jgi:molybdopterin-containing oxidoreductase family membrane subunit